MGRPMNEAKQVGGVRGAIRRMKPDRASLGSDLAAALTFSVVNVPQAMGDALLATVNPVLGIFTLMVAAPVGAIFNSSAFMNVSSTGALSMATGVILLDFPSEQKLQALVVLVLLVGTIQLLAGVLRLGFLTRFVSNAVMTGFLNGVAVLIMLGQLGNLTGYRSQFSNRVAQALDLVLRLNQVNLWITAIGLVTLGLIVALLWVKSLRRFAFIVAIAAATVLLVLLSLQSASGFATVPTVGDMGSIPRALPQLVFPDLTLIPALLLPALSLAVIGLVQGAGVSQGTPNPDGRYPNVSRDFLGQGAANIAAGLVSGIPAGGSVSGTALILGAGGKSRWANIFVGFFVTAIVLLAAPLVELVPMPALAALLVVAGFQGLRVSQGLIVWRTGWVSKAVMLMTFAATLAMPLQYAVLVGVALSLGLHVARQSNKVVVTQWVLQPQGFPVEQAAPERLPSNQLTLLQVYGSLFFAAAKNLEEMLPKVDGTTNAVLAINLRGKSEIGSTFMTVLQRYSVALRARGSKLMLVGVDPAVRDQLARTGVLKSLGEENVFVATSQIGAALNQAVAAAEAWLRQSTPGTGTRGTAS
jgi:sulfate permease, SulP family